MSLTENELLTLRRYDVSAEDWLAHSGGRDRSCYWEEQMNNFVSLLGGNIKVIEVGCGQATDGKYLRRYGVDCVSMDYSEGMLHLARELNPDIKLFQMNLYNMGFKDNSFDGFWATACLLHLENPEEALKELARITKPGGIGFITVREGEGEVVDSKTGYYFKYFNDSEFRKILTLSNMELLSFARKKGSPDYDWLMCTVKVIK